MLKNYFKISLRNLLKHRISSIINITGLSIGMACCMLILFYVQHERGYDKFHNNIDVIYRVVYEYNNKDKNIHKFDDATHMPIAPMLLHDFPEIQNAVRILEYPSKMEYKDKQFIENDISYCDPNIFSIFTFQVLAGNPLTALSDPSSVVISREIADKYFGVEDPIGKTIKIEENDFKITGIVKDFPDNSSLKYKVFLPLLSFKRYSALSTDWSDPSVITFIQLTSGQSVKNLEENINISVKKYLSEYDAPKTSYRLQPLRDIHLFSKSNFGIDSNGDYQIVVLYSSVAIFILLIACINFINITTGQFTSRFKEIGLRKILGAKRSQIIKQFWGEVSTLCLISVCIALIIVEMLLPGFNSLINRKISVEYSLISLAGIVAIVLFTGLLVAIFPSIILSGYKPVEVLKRKINTGGSKKFTKTLIVVQFFLSILFLSCFLIISNQLNFIMDKHKISKSDNVLNVDFRHLESTYSKDQMVNLSKLFFNEISGSSFIISSTVLSGNIRMVEYQNDGKTIKAATNDCDEGFLETQKIKIIEGRNFSAEKYATDISNSIIVNEAFVQENNLKSPTQTIISSGKNNYTIIGVIENHKSGVLKSKVKPTILKLSKETGFLQSFRFYSKDLDQLLGLVNKKWKEIFPHQIINYTFTDENIRKMYSTEINTREILNYVSILALILSSFGILSLTINTIARRIKEIGLRKVLGASVTGIIFILIKEFILLIIIALILASPIAYYYMERWLQAFAYRIDVNLWIFILSGSIVSIAALSTIIILTMKAALANPIDSLRYE
jgi:putative ABC transport system permease protein